MFYTQSNQKTDVLATGLNGLVGSKLTASLDQYNFANIDRADPQFPVDITNIDQVKAAFAKSSSKVVIHLAAFTAVTRYPKYHYRRQRNW